MTLMVYVRKHMHMRRVDEGVAQADAGPGWEER